MCSFREWGRYWVRIITSEIPEFTQLDSVKSMMRYFPAKGTAGLARFSVSTPSREPSPPARITARALIRGLLSRVGRLRAFVERGVLLRRPRPGEVPGHPIALELGPFGGLSVHLQGALERVPEGPSVELVEHEAGPAGLPGVDDRVGQTPGPPGHGHAPVTHGDHLRQTAGLVARRDHQGVGPGVDPAGVTRVEAQPDAGPMRVAHLELGELVLDGRIAGAQKDELAAAVEPALDGGGGDVESLLLDQQIG